MYYIGKPARNLDRCKFIDRITDSIATQQNTIPFFFQNVYACCIHFLLSLEQLR